MGIWGVINREVFRGIQVFVDSQRPWNFDFCWDFRYRRNELNTITPAAFGGRFSHPRCESVITGHAACTYTTIDQSVKTAAVYNNT